MQCNRRSTRAWSAHLHRCNGAACANRRAPHFERWVCEYHSARAAHMDTTCTHAADSAPFRWLSPCCLADWYPAITLPISSCCCLATPVMQCRAEWHRFMAPPPCCAPPTRRRFRVYFLPCR
eukprot:IDg18779t1